MNILEENKLLRRKRHGNLRQLRVVQPLIDFASNDYLGLARSSTFVNRVNQEVTLHSNGHHALGSTGSRLLTGNSFYVQDLENSIAAFHGYEAGLIFNCGYMANIGLLSAVMNNSSTVFLTLPSTPLFVMGSN